MKNTRNLLGAAGIGALAALFAAAVLVPAAAHAQARPGFGGRDNGRPDRDRPGRDRPGWGDDRPGDDSDDQNNIRQLRSTLSTDRTSYGTDRGVVITLSLQNTGRSPMEVRQRNVYEYDITIRSRSGQTVWQWSRTPGARRVDRTLRLEPNETRTFREVWDQRDNGGRRVEGGTYVIEASVYPKAPMNTQIFLSGRDDDDGRPGDGPGWPGRPGRPGEGDDRPGWGDRGDLRGEVSLSDSTPEPGERVRIEYAVTNRGRDTETLRFNSGRQFEVEVRSGDRIVWRHSIYRSYTQALTDLTLRPGERKTFTAEWTPDRSLRAGTYDVAAYLVNARSGDGSARARTSVRLEGRGWGEGGGSWGGDYGRDEEWGRGGNARRISGRDLARNPGEYVGERVTLTATLLGSKGRGFGMGGFRGSQHYWVVQADGERLYVTGAEPRARVGSTVRITGTVRRSSEGQVYLNVD